MATENLGANENKKAGEGAKKPRPADGKAPAKKKKIIIVTGNSSKSRQSSGQRGAYSSGSYSGGGTGSFSSGSGRKPRPAGQGGARRDQAGGRQKVRRRSPGLHRTRSSAPALSLRRWKLITISPNRLQDSPKRLRRPLRRLRRSRSRLPQQRQQNPLSLKRL